MFQLPQCKLNARLRRRRKWVDRLRRAAPAFENPSALAAELGQRAAILKFERLFRQKVGELERFGEALVELVPSQCGARERAREVPSPRVRREPFDGAPDLPGARRGGGIADPGGETLQMGSGGFERHGLRVRIGKEHGGVSERAELA